MDLSSVFDKEMYKNESAKTFVIKTLRNAIQKGLLKGGDPLRQEEIATQLRVSHIPVREALRQLESEGLVASLPYRGATVASLSPTESRDIFTIREFLEKGALELAIPNLTDMDLMKAELTLKIADNEDYVDRWSELNWEFHSTLYRPCRNTRLLHLIEEMHMNVNRYLRIYLSLMEHQRISQSEHYRLLEACKNKNVKEACSALETHLLNASDNLAGFLEECQKS